MCRTLIAGGWAAGKTQIGAVIMAKRLTDKEKKKIIADRVDGMSIRQLSKKYKVSTTTIQRIIHGNPEITQMVTQKKDENTADILAFMDGKKQDVCDIISLYLEYLKDPDKLKRASVQSIATSLGIIIDKFTKDAEKQADTSLFENIVKAAEGKFETN